MYNNIKNKSKPQYMQLFYMFNSIFEERRKMNLDEAWNQLTTIVKDNFKRDANMTITKICHGDVPYPVYIQEANNEHSVMFPIDWEKNNLKEGVDLKELASQIQYTPGYRISLLLQDELL